VSDQIVQDLWNDRTAWSVAADKLKSARVFWRSTALIFTVAGAALQTWAAAISQPKSAVGAAGAVLLAFVPFITARLLTPDLTRKWLRARSVSEGIKSEIFAYRAGAAPYDAADATDKLRAKVREIEDSGKDLELERARVDPSPSQPPPALEPEGYLERRVQQQIANYYRPKAKLNAMRAEQFRWVETFFAAAAALLGAYASFSGRVGFGPWVAVLTTAAGTISAHAAASRYDFQATTFVATARQLEDLMHGWRDPPKKAPSKEWSEFVRACEETISAENRGWMAKLEQNQ
jgi:SMODS and SLOG-associating 2TM effector domain 1/Protein of unknown function (DUF4231)